MFDTGRLSPSEDDISVFVSRLVEAEVSEAQLGAWLMATYVHGLSVQVSLVPYNINRIVTLCTIPRRLRASPAPWWAAA